MILASFALALSASSARPSTDEPRRPNIVLLLADDQRADTVGRHGNSHVMTPNVDSLVDRGFSFRNAYCMGSPHGAVCVPSRAMLLSGRHLFEVKMDLADTPTLPQALADAGYATFATGKWHNGEASFLASFQAGQSIFFGGMCDHTKVVVRDRPRGEDLTEPRDGGAFSSELFADAAVEFLGSRDEDSAPFFLYVAFTAPHDPRQPPERWRQHYDDQRPPLPANYMPQHPFHNGWMRGRDENLAGWPRTREVVSDQLAEYYGMISHLDEQVGRVLDALEASGLAEDTIVVYTADHGLAMGSHGLLGKQSLYEHSTKSPLVVAGPGVPHGESEALVYLFDLVPTLCSLAGATPPEGFAGRDVGTIWRGEADAVREQLFTSYEDKMRAVRDGRWKLIRYPRLNHTQLFDLEADPDELVDLAASPDHEERVRSMTADLARWQTTFGDGQPLTSEHPDPMEYDPSGWTRKPDTWQPAWIREKYFGE